MFWKKKLVVTVDDMINATKLSPCRACKGEVHMYCSGNNAWIDGCHVCIPFQEADHHLKSKKKCQEIYEYVNKHLRVLEPQQDN